jgi:hypothetical protein
MASRLVFACLLAVVIFAVPCLSLSRIACNNVKQGMDVAGADSRFFNLVFVFLLSSRDCSQAPCAPKIRPTVCATSRTRYLPRGAYSGARPFSRAAGQVLQGVQRR